MVIYNPENVSKPPEAARLVELAKELGLDAKAVQFRTAEDIERAFSAFATDHPDGLVVLTEQRSIAHAKLLAELSRRGSGSQSCIRSAKVSTRAVSSPTVPTFRRWC